MNKLFLRHPSLRQISATHSSSSPSCSFTSLSRLHRQGFSSNFISFRNFTRISPSRPHFFTSSSSISSPQQSSRLFIISFSPPFYSRSFTTSNPTNPPPANSPPPKSAQRKKTKIIRQVEIEADDYKSLGHYDDESLITQQQEYQKVRAVCTSESYDLAPLYANLLQTYPTCQLFANEVIRFLPSGKECFIFVNLGTLVSWDMTREEFDQLSLSLKKFEINSIQPTNPATGNPIPSTSASTSTPTTTPPTTTPDSLVELEYDEMNYLINPSQELSTLSQQYEPILIIGGKQSHTNIYLDQLSFSHGIANSVKLGVLENQLDLFVDSIKHLPIVLKNGQKISLTRTQSLSKLGELLQFRAVLNLHSGLIETPDLYWNYFKLEQHFRVISKEFDIKQRVEALNKKLDYANDIAELLKGYLSERHSLELEWAIIILIAVEVGFELLHFAERLM